MFKEVKLEPIEVDVVRRPSGPRRVLEPIAVDVVRRPSGLAVYLSQSTFFGALRVSP